MPRNHEKLIERKTKPCIACGKLLEPATPFGWSSMQPEDGGEVKLIFSYGSCKFDLEPDCTTFKGVICDDCAESMMDRLERVE